MLLENNASDLASYGLFGVVGSIMLFLVMMLVGVFAIYFAGKWFGGEESMWKAIIISFVVFLVGLFLFQIPVWGLILLLLWVILFIFVIWILYKKPGVGLFDAFMIWIVAMVMTLALGLLVTVGLIFLWVSILSMASVNPLLVYVVIGVLIIVCGYILYWFLARIMSGSKRNK